MMPLSMEESLELRRLEDEAMKLSEEVDKKADRAVIAKSTVGAGTISGSNAFSPDLGKWPWMDIQYQMAAYWDRRATKPKSLRPIGVARGHLKTEIGCHALARHVCLHPETRNGIIGATADRALANLANITDILESDRWQRAFPDVLYPSGDRNHYTNDELTVKRKGAYREPTIKAGGIEANWAGVHFGAGSVLWMDDCVNKQNAATPEQRIKIWELMNHIIQYVCDPGCHVCITYTRYAHDDAYSYLLDPDGPWAGYIEEGAINVGCWVVGEGGTLRAVYPMRYCIEPRDKLKRVHWKGERYNPPRESLLEKKKMAIPAEWNAQMMNNPQPEDSIIFRTDYFRFLPGVNGLNLSLWLKNRSNVLGTITKSEGEADRGQLIPVILGDPSYGAKSHNDFQVAAVVIQDAWGFWYVCEAYHDRLGTPGLEKYIRTMLRWQRQYQITMPWGIETHSREAMIPLIEQFARQENMSVQFAKLTLNTNEGKEKRYGALEPLFRNGQVYFCENVKWFMDLARNEMTQFGGGQRHDDIGDCLSNGLQVFPPRSGVRGMKAIDLYPDRMDVSMAW